MVTRNKLWSAIDGQTNVVAAGVAGNIGTKVGANLLAGMGISHLAGWTVGPAYLTILIHNDNDNSSAGNVKAHVGLMIGQGGLDNGDFPDLSFGDGDYFLRKSMIFNGGGAVNALVAPPQRSFYEVTSRSSRRLERIGDTVWLVYQHSAADDYIFDWSLTFMAMAP